MSVVIVGSDYLPRGVFRSWYIYMYHSDRVIVYDFASPAPNDGLSYS